ncbi:hypothetical protein ES332_A08G183800v1 [Gossypium tomentosum]|uniref:Uncharacterized protein n=1 Tax=Gossypium tomentosum TaxID=34277 RepID=A0A5D2PJC1_GOSTO|nr:hypothetical protein ES332_A08G183800v1 [Gossypium tomentosum]
MIHPRTYLQTCKKLRCKMTIKSLRKLFVRDLFLDEYMIAKIFLSYSQSCFFFFPFVFILLCKRILNKSQRRRGFPGSTPWIGVGGGGAEVPMTLVHSLSG